MLAAAALASPTVVAGLIPDGIHVHPALVRLIWQLTGPDRLNLVSDAMASAVITAASTCGGMLRRRGLRGRGSSVTTRAFPHTPPWSISSIISIAL